MGFFSRLLTLKGNLIGDSGTAWLVKTKDQGDAGASHVLGLSSGQAGVNNNSGAVSLSSGDQVGGGGDTGQVDVRSGNAGGANASSGPVALESGTTNTNTGTARVASGDAGDDSGNVDIKSGGAGNNSGNVTRETGTAGGTRGKIFDLDGSEGTPGNVWTEGANPGEGSWQPPAAVRLVIESINSDPGAGLADLGKVYNTDTSAGPFNFQLPDPAVVGSGWFVYIKDETGSFGINNLTLLRFAGEMIEFLAADKILSANFLYKKVYTDGSNWWVS